MFGSSLVFRIFGFLLLALFFVGCSSENENDGTKETNTLFVGASVITKTDFSVVLPASWKEFSVSEIGENSQAKAAFRRIESVSGGYPNIVVHEETLPETLSALEFFTISRDNEQDSLIGFQKVSEDQITLSGHPAVLFEFLARLEPDGNEYRYWQLFFIQNQKGIVVTGSAPKEADEKVIFEIESILKNIRIPKAAT